MTQTSLGVLLLFLIFCVWPLLVHAGIVWAARRDWSSSGEFVSKFFSALHKEDEE